MHGKRHKVAHANSEGQDQLAACTSRLSDQGLQRSLSIIIVGSSRKNIRNMEGPDRTAKMCRLVWVILCLISCRTWFRETSFLYQQKFSSGWCLFTLTRKRLRCLVIYGKYDRCIINCVLHLAFYCVFFIFR